MGVSFDTYWKQLCSATPELGSGDETHMTISVVVFKEQLRMAFHIGRQSVEDSKGAAQDFENVGKPVFTADDLLKNIWKCSGLR